MQSVFPLPQSACGVFHRYSELRNLTLPQYEYSTVLMICWPPLPYPFAIRLQDWVLLPAAPYQRPTCACTCGVSVHSIHWSMQFGCAACEEIIHVSAHPVTPSDGITAATGASAFA